MNRNLELNLNWKYIFRNGIKSGVRKEGKDRKEYTHRGVRTAICIKSCSNCKHIL